MYSYDEINTDHLSDEQIQEIQDNACYDCVYNPVNNRNVISFLWDCLKYWLKIHRSNQKYATRG